MMEVLNVRLVYSNLGNYSHAENGNHRRLEHDRLSLDITSQEAFRRNDSFWQDVLGAVQQLAPCSAAFQAEGTYLSSLPAAQTPLCSSTSPSDSPPVRLAWSLMPPMAF